RAGHDVRTAIDVVADGDDVGEHLAQVGCDRDFLHRVHDLAVLDPESARAARVVAGDQGHTLPHQFGDHEAAAHSLQHPGEIVFAAADEDVVHAAGIAGAAQSELARRVAAEQVTGHPAAADQVRIPRGHAFHVVCGRGLAAPDVRSLDDVHEL